MSETVSKVSKTENEAASQVYRLAVDFSQISLSEVEFRTEQKRIIALLTRALAERVTELPLNTEQLVCVVSGLSRDLFRRAPKKYSSPGEDVQFAIANEVPDRLTEQGFPTERYDAFIAMRGEQLKKSTQFTLNVVQAQSSTSYGKIELHLLVTRVKNPSLLAQKPSAVLSEITTTQQEESVDTADKPKQAPFRWLRAVIFGEK